MIAINNISWVVPPRPATFCLQSLQNAQSPLRNRPSLSFLKPNYLQTDAEEQPLGEKISSSIFLLFNYKYIPIKLTSYSKIQLVT